MDDADSNRKILMMLLKRKNVKCVGCEDGQEALNAVIKEMHRFKLVFMDNLMPIMTGMEAAREMRKIGFPYLICGITGNVTESDMDEYISAGSDLILPKPIKLEQITKIQAFIELNGPLSRWSDNQKLELDGNGDFQWVSRKQ